jgi:hypothetical protein
MQGTVDYRLLERFRAHRRLNLVPPPERPLRQLREAAGAARADDRHVVRTIDLRD